MSRPLSHHPILYYLGVASGLLVIGFGLNIFRDPVQAMSFFEIDKPSSADGVDFFDLMLPVYGIRNLALGSNILAAAYRKDHKLLGWGIFVFAMCAVVDGVVCYKRGHGQGQHWGYAPQLIILSSFLMGLFDGKMPVESDKKAA